MNNRICEIRKDKKYNQENFAKELGLTKNYISLIENGNRTPSDRTVSDICRVFAVNEEWLRTGEGEKYQQSHREEEIADLFFKVNSAESEIARSVVSILAGLSVQEWELIERMAWKLVNELKPDK